MIAAQIILAMGMAGAALTALINISMKMDRAVEILEQIERRVEARRS